MKQIGNVYILKDDEGPGISEYFDRKVMISLTLTPNPEYVWAHSDSMIDYVNDKNKKLQELGIITGEAMEHLKNCDSHVGIATEFKTLEEAEFILEKAIEADIVDIYLYKNCELYRKYD